MTKIEYLKLQIEILGTLLGMTVDCPTGGIYDQLYRRYELEHQAYSIALLKAEKEET